MVSENVVKEAIGTFNNLKLSHILSYFYEIKENVIQIVVEKTDDLVEEDFELIESIFLGLGIDTYDCVMDYNEKDQVIIVVNY